MEEQENNEIQDPVRDSSASEKPAEEQAPEKRRGFHPALVIGTLAACLSVLWIGPKVLMWARIEPNQAAAITVLESLKGKNISNPDVMAAAARLHKSEASGAYQLVFSGSSDVYQVPRFYGNTAVLTFCLKNHRLYSCDVKEPDIRKLPQIDEKWQLVGEQKDK